MKDKVPPWVLAEFTIPQLVLLANKGKLPRPRRDRPEGKDEPWIRPEAW